MFADLNQKTIGFLGCGKISSALCRGYANCSPKRLYVSRRNVEKSEALKREFPDLVEVIDDNSELVILSDIIFIGLLPPVAAELLSKLPFTEKKLVISMMAAVNFERTLSMLPQIPSKNIVRTVPLPSSAQNTGPILMYPNHDEAMYYLKFIGTPIVCSSEEKLKPLISVTGHISSFYELMRETEDFLESKGVERDIATQFVKAFYSSLSRVSETADDGLLELRDEAATPKGLNEQSLQFLRNSAHFTLHRESLEQILQRLNR